MTKSQVSCPFLRHGIESLTTAVATGLWVAIGD